MGHVHESLSQVHYCGSIMHNVTFEACKPIRPNAFKAALCCGQEDGVYCAASLNDETLHP